MALTVENFRELLTLSADNSFHNDCGFPQAYDQWLAEENVQQLTLSLIRSYQERCFGTLNRYLRTEHHSQNPLYDLRVKLLNAALDTLPSIESKVLWRNEGDAIEVMRWASKNIGQIVLIPSFWSTYINPDNWKATTPTFKILTSANSNARSISEHTNFQRGETEALYKPNTMFKVLSVEQVTTWGDTEAEVVIVEEVMEGKPDIIAYEGYTVSQDDADHSSLPLLSASDLGWI
jgi:ADP-ribosyltransferase exoenzyme